MDYKKVFNSIRKRTPSQLGIYSLDEKRNAIKNILRDAEPLSRNTNFVQHKDLDATRNK